MYPPVASRVAAPCGTAHEVRAPAHVTRPAWNTTTASGTGAALGLISVACTMAKAGGAGFGAGVVRIAAMTATAAIGARERYARRRGIRVPGSKGKGRSRRPIYRSGCRDVRGANE